MSDAPTTTPPPAPPSSRPPLRRPKEGRMLAGVAAGIALHLGVDVAIVRIVLVVLAVVTNGVAVLAYVAAIFLIPEAEHDAVAGPAEPIGRGQSDRDPSFWVGIALLVVGALWLLSGGGPIGRAFPWWSGQLLWPLVLIAFGFALWRSGDRRPAAPVGAALGRTASAATSPASVIHPGPPAPPTPPAATAAFASETAMTTDTDTTRMTGSSGTTDTVPLAPPPGSWEGTAAAVPPASPPPPPTGEGPREPQWTPPPVPEERDRSILTRLTLGLTLVVVGVLWSLRLADLIVLAPGQILAAGLLVVGLGLIVGAFVGRGRGLLVAGALLVPLVLLATVARPFGFDTWTTSTDTPVGDIRETVTAAQDLADEYRFGAGSLTLDLSALRDAGDLETTIAVGAGELIVLVPEGAGLDIDARVGIGEIELPDGVNRSGLGLNAELQREPAAGFGTTLNLDISAGVGSIEVRRATPPPAVDDAQDTTDDTTSDTTSDDVTTEDEGAAALVPAA